MAGKDRSGKNSLKDVTFDQSRLAASLGCFSAYPRIALAVSGGADSTAFALLTRRWLDAGPDGQAHTPDITVLTVDHGLRPESAAEARWVAELSARLGFRHETLSWSGDKPATGIQASARKARYRLLTAFCRAHGIPALATAHHADDQAETFMMRLQRGSGVDGLAAMRPRSEREGVDLLRPLLSFRRGELQAFLQAEGQDWREDPSNRDEGYERIRLRNALMTAGELGLTSAGLSLTTKRLLRARNALDRTTAEFLKRRLTLNDAGFGTIPVNCLLDEAEEIGLRALIRVAAAFGGRKALRLMKAEDAYSRLSGGVPGLTLAGCHFTARGGVLTASREYGRMPKTPVPIENGMLWDGRFRISLGEPELVPGDMVLRALGTDGIRLARDAEWELKKMPRTAMLALPSFWRGNELRCIPSAAHGGSPAAGTGFRPEVAFANRELLYSAAFSGVVDA
jgi:tRNA(Ile)-lysidine synthase